MPTRLLVIACLLIAAPCARAELFPLLPLATDPLQPPRPDQSQKKITLDNLPTGFGGFATAAPTTWLDDDHFLQIKGGKWLKVQALTGQAEPYYDSARLAQALAVVPGVSKNTAATLAQNSPLLVNPQRSGGLFTTSEEMYYCNFDGTGGTKLPKLAGAEMPTFSPDGKRVAFVRNFNLFVFDMEAQSERQLTKDGNGILSNGKADWVYYEELFHRKYKAFWWSPDSKHIAFLQFDDSKVAKYTLLPPTERVQTPEVATYPKAGAANPTVKVGIAAANGQALNWVDLGDYPDPSPLVPRADWLADGKTVYLYVQDRAQTWLDVCTVPVAGGKPAKLFRETTKAWVEDLGPLTLLKDGSFLFISERSGYRHLYHYAGDGNLKGPVTSGDWEMRKLERVDEAGGWVYFSGTRDGWLGSNGYRVKLDGSGLERLTKKAGTHNLNVSPAGKYFVDSWSNYDTPPQLCLCKGDGELVRVIDAGADNPLKDYQVGKHEFVKIKMPDGFTLPATVLLPPDYNANKKYPVWFMTYGGPHAPTIRNAFSQASARDQALAAMGFIIFRFDPRSASAMGAVSTWTAYRQLGVQELKDVEAALTWLTEKYPAADGKRIGMSGHSYGGYLTAYCLTHSKMFAAGIAGSPVTDWHNYDSIYTERYMSTPQDNPKGYEVSSVVKGAKNLQGRLMLVHGMMDDNVHVQNTMQLVDALQKADKDFELMIYPKARHGLPGASYQRLQVEFMKRVLQP
jgi:dipeptidyl-peptidase-4